MHGTLHRTSTLAVLAAGLLAAPAAGAQQMVRLPAEDRALALRTTPVYSVGKAEGNDSEMFTRVDQVAFDRADNLYVLDGGANRVLVFDRAGRFVRQLGKRGGGPGEFMAPLGMAVTPDGSVAVADLGHRGYSVFSPDGRYQRSIAFVDPWMPDMMNGRMTAHPRGGVVATVRPAPTMLPGARGSSEVTPILWQPFGEGAKPVTFFDSPVEVNISTEAGSAQQGQRAVSLRRMIPSFTPPLTWSVLPGGAVVVTNTPGYTLKVMDGGRPVRYIQKPLRVRKVTERDRDRERKRLREVFTSGAGMRSFTIGGGGAAPRPRGLSQEQIERSLSELQFADVIPEIQDIRVDGAGRIWVERTGESWGEPGPIDVVTAEGRYLGTVTGQALPDAFSASGRAAY
ncbi:MAG TPA: 6-bladed beta-propeller, partial [Longimicrobiaceae bacterium]|nr:6-bladed beta-propeller [Longimicrobiaceae bacterium]